jgi:NADP-dependent 3-hydroxy acid dehydrogenase YdfG
MAVHLDVTERAALAAAMDAVEKELGALDVLVNNAGVAVMLRGAAPRTAPERWRRRRRIPGPVAASRPPACPAQREG